VKHGLSTTRVVAVSAKGFQSRMKRYLALSLAAALATPLAACSGGGHVSALPASGAASTQTQTHQRVRHLKSDRNVKDVLGGLGLNFSLSLSLFDAPLTSLGTNVVFNAGILGVDAIDTSGDSWQLIANQTPNVVDLLTLQTQSLNLGSGNLPAGSYPSLQLLLDPSTTNVTIDGQTYPVAFVTPDHPWWDPSQTIEAVQVPLTVNGTAGQSVTASLDFNVFQSANLSNGVVYLTPKVAAGFGSPRIHGVVANSAGSPVNNATIVATDATGAVANVTVTAADGSFNLHGINPGSYTLSVANTYTTDAGVTVTASGADTGAAPSMSIVVGPTDSLNVGTLND
jgi:hypothetical protein